MGGRNERCLFLLYVIFDAHGVRFLLYFPKGGLKNVASISQVSVPKKFSPSYTRRYSIPFLHVALP